MRFEAGVGGCCVLRAELRRLDARGYAFELNDADAWARRGVGLKVARTLISVSGHRVLRGVHYNDHTAPMRKWMTCLSGSIFEAVIDLQRASSTFCRVSHFILWPGDEVFVPETCAHGYAVISDDCAAVNYRLSAPRQASAERAIHWKSIDAPWPVDEPVQSVSDARAVDLDVYLAGHMEPVPS